MYKNEKSDSVRERRLSRSDFKDYEFILNDFRLRYMLVHYCASYRHHHKSQHGGRGEHTLDVAVSPVLSW